MTVSSFPRRHPLPDTFPQFSVVESDSYVEYNIQNSYLARDGSGRIVSGTESLIGLLDIILVQNLQLWFIVASLVFILYRKCTQILSESLILIAPHGVQLETHFGLALLGLRKKLSTKRRFIPAKQIQDIIINEGLSGWNVRFYMAIVRRITSSPTGDEKFEVVCP
ncbi:hypothetical protein H0H93_002494, partial [Arthromyces matolae]